MFSFAIVIEEQEHIFVYLNMIFIELDIIWSDGVIIERSANLFHWNRFYV